MSAERLRREGSPKSGKIVGADGASPAGNVGEGSWERAGVHVSRVFRRGEKRGADGQRGEEAPEGMLLTPSSTPA